MGKLMLNDRCYTGSDNLLILNDESYSGGVPDCAVVQNLKLNEGKLDVRTGIITADSDYYYSDLFPCPMTTAFFDVGESSQDSNIGFAIYDSAGVYTEFFTANARYRVVNIASYIPDPTGYTCRLSFAKAHLEEVMLKDISGEVMYCANTPVVIGNDHYRWKDNYVDLSSFALFYRRNTTEPTVTHISSTEVSFSFQDQNASGYELCSFRLPLETGIYVAEIKATVDKNTGLNTSYGWGIYSSRADDGANMNNNTPYEYRVIGNYVAFDRSDTAEHYYEVPINIVWNAAENNGYVCFTTAADNGVNATITVSSLKIRKV